MPHLILLDQHGQRAGHIGKREADGLVAQGLAVPILRKTGKPKPVVRLVVPLSAVHGGEGERPLSASTYAGTRFVRKTMVSNGHGLVPLYQHK